MTVKKRVKTILEEVSKTPYSDDELKDMAWKFAHEHFSMFGVPLYHSGAMSDILFNRLKQARDGKD